MDHVLLACGHGWFNMVGGACPLLHMRSFERVFGPKTDRWLVRAVAGLMLTNGVTQILASPLSARCAKRAGSGWERPSRWVSSIWCTRRRAGSAGSICSTPCWRSAG